MFKNGGQTECWSHLFLSADLLHTHVRFVVDHECKLTIVQNVRWILSIQKTASYMPVPVQYPLGVRQALYGWSNKHHETMPEGPRTTAEQRQHLVGWLQRPVQEHLPRALHCTVGKKVGDPDHPSLLWAIPCKHVLKAKLKLEPNALF